MGTAFNLAISRVIFFDSHCHSMPNSSSSAILIIHSFSFSLSLSDSLSFSLSLSLYLSLCPSSSPILCSIIYSSCTKIAFTCHFNRIFVAVLACKRFLLLLSFPFSLHFSIFFVLVYAQMFCFAKKYDCNILLTSLWDLKTTEGWERERESESGL